MGRQLTYLALLVALFGTGCDRPFVAIEPPSIEVISPDLKEVQLADNVRLLFRVTSLRRVTRVEINSEEAAPTLEADVFEFVTTLSEGSNMLLVNAFDSEGNVGSDTLYSVHLPYSTANIVAATLPEPLASHTATRLADGSLLISGGFDASGAPSASSYIYIEQGVDFLISELPAGLAHARAGHTTSLLPDGRVLIVGGSSVVDPNGTGDFTPIGELYDPSGGGFSTPSFAGEAILRAFHTAATLTDEGRTFVYLFGGRGIVSGSAVQTRSDVTVLEVRSTSAGDSLINLSPGGAVGAFPAVAHHIQLPLQDEGGFLRTLVAGTYQPPDGGGTTPVAFRFLYTPSTFFFPFEVLEESLPFMQVPRIDHAGALVTPRLAFATGGRTPDGIVLDNLEVFSDEARQFFLFPASTALRTARHQHTATLLPSGRILLLGGVNISGTTIGSAEYILPPLP